MPEDALGGSQITINASFSLIIVKSAFVEVTLTDAFN